MKIKKYLAEFIGTMVLVLFGCGTAVVLGGVHCGSGSGYSGVVPIALAFGLSIVAMAYAIGHVSGCHVNPAVSFAMLINKKMSVTDFIGYVVAQILGAFAGSGILYAITKTGNVAGFGSNGFGPLSASNLTVGGAVIVEVVLTCVFVLTILGVTSSEKTSGIAGIVIGATLTFVHIIGIPLTGTSVNPARSIAPAVFEAISGNSMPLTQVWVFILAPLVGAAIAALLFKFIFADKEAE